MSTYVVRIIEVKKNNSKGYLYSKSDLEAVKPNPGDIYFFNNFDRGFKLWTGTEWIPTEPEYKWERVVWKGEDNYFCDNGGPIRDYILGYWSPYEDLKERGIPRDCSPELKKELEKEGYKHTWILYSELSSIQDKELLKFKDKVRKISDSSALARRLDRLEELISKGKSEIKIEEPDPEETLDYVFEDDIWTLLSVTSEMAKIRIITEEFSGYAKDEDIRINYYFC